MEWTEKYRPRKFSELVGQDRAAKVLENDVDNPKSTYILKGKGGGGKTTAARIFAAALNCEDRKDGNPCGECLSCRTILSGANSPSVEEISAAVANSVEDARNLVNDTTRATAGLKRVFILDECHMMSRNAWDALLKLLENPPKDTHFLLVTTEYHKIPDTIKTRSRTISFDPITDDKVAEHLKWVCEQEGHDVTDEQVNTAVIAGGGSMRLAMKSMESVIDGNIDVSSNDSWDNFVQSVKDRNLPHMLSLSNVVLDEGIIDPRMMVERLFEIFVDSTINGAFENYGGPGTLIALRELSRALSIMGSTGSQKVAAQAALVSLCTPVEFDSSSVVSTQVMSFVRSEVTAAVKDALNEAQIAHVAPQGTSPTREPLSTPEPVTVESEGVSHTPKDEVDDTKSISEGDTKDIAEESSEESSDVWEDAPQMEDDKIMPNDIDSWLNEVESEFGVIEDTKTVKAPTSQKDIDNSINTMKNRADLFNSKELSMCLGNVTHAENTGGTLSIHVDVSNISDDEFGEAIIQMSDVAEFPTMLIEDEGVTTTLVPTDNEGRMSMVKSILDKAESEGVSDAVQCIKGIYDLDGDDTHISVMVDPADVDAKTFFNGSTWINDNSPVKINLTRQ